MKNRYPRLAASAVALLAGCSFMAVQTAPAKVAATTRSAQSLQADELFWATLHVGDYEKIPTVLTALTAAYLDNPSDAVTAASPQHAQRGGTSSSRVRIKKKNVNVSHSPTSTSGIKNRVKRYGPNAVAMTSAE